MSHFNSLLIFLFSTAHRRDSNHSFIQIGNWTLTTYPIWSLRSLPLLGRLRYQRLCACENRNYFILFCSKFSKSVEASLRFLHCLYIVIRLQSQHLFSIKNPPKISLGGFLCSFRTIWICKFYIPIPRPSQPLYIKRPHQVRRIIILCEIAVFIESLVSFCVSILYL